MPVSLSDFLQIDSEELNRRHVFDTILDYDSRFFINYMRLKDTKATELVDSYQKLHDFFNRICVLLEAASSKEHRFFREAKNLFNMHEFEEICLGYSLKGTSGSGSGEKLKSIILSTAKDIIDAGVKRPEIFELVGLFEEGIGPDRISDMIGRIIIDDLKSYSRNRYSELLSMDGISDHVQIEDGILINPYNSKQLVLLPKDILHELPIAAEWEDIDYVCAVNHEIREQINNRIGEEWKKLTTKKKKNIFRSVVFERNDLLDKLIDDYADRKLDEYDFERDPLGEAIWYELAKKYSNEYPLSLEKEVKTQKDLIDEVRKICEQFKQLIEYNGLNEVLYDDNGSPRKERIAQKVFYAVADSYCDVNNTDINPEVNSGRGPVDFKFSFGRDEIVLVEVKLTTNNKLLHGYEKQLQEYMRSERTEDAFYLVIDNGGSESKIERLIKTHEDYVKKGCKTHELIFINGEKKKSASKV